jgi:hypothetical protein
VSVHGIDKGSLDGITSVGVGGVRVDGYYGMRTQVTSDTVSTG